MADEQLNVLSYDQMVEEIESQRSAAQWAAALNAASSELNSNQQAYSTTNHYGTINNGGNSYRYSGTSRTYDPSKAEAAKRQVRQDAQNAFDRSNQQAAQSYEQLRYYLKTTTIPRGKSYTGMFYVEKLFSLDNTSLVVDQTPIRVHVQVGNEKHSFQINKKVHAAN